MYALILRAGPPQTVQPMYHLVVPGVYTPIASPRAPCILMRQTSSSPSPNSKAWVLDVFDQSKRHLSSCCKRCYQRSRLSEECMVLLRKQKYFSFLGSVPTWVSVKKHKSWSVASLIIRGVGSKNKHIRRKVKCAHLVPEPSSRWRRHVVP
jgi:hypothetical protein